MTSSLNDSMEELLPKIRSQMSNFVYGSKQCRDCGGSGSTRGDKYSGMCMRCGWAGVEGLNWKACEEIMKLIHQELTKTRLEELEKMTNHYSLKDGNVLLYEENGENIYLGDRIATLTTELKEGEK